jgi:hypothetical protein
MSNGKMTNLEKDLEGYGGDLIAGIAHSAAGWLIEESGFDSQQGQDIFLGRLWDPFSLLSNRYRGLFSRR